MTFYVLTLFPEIVQGALCHSIIKRAMDNNLLRLECIDIRGFSGNKHHRVDDAPYGGGAGMVLRPQPVYDAYLYAKTLAGSKHGDYPVIYMSPQGKPFTQHSAKRLAALP